MLHVGMNYFSLTSKAVLHASFLGVMRSIFSPAVAWADIPALRATTGQRKAPAEDPVAWCAVTSALACQLLWQELHLLAADAVGWGSDCFLWSGRLEYIGRCSHI